MRLSKISICRVYNPPIYKDGLWVLVDRLWPRGLKKDALDIDLWLKDIAPSATLRKWFNHDPAKWVAFSQHYVEELQLKPALIADLLEKAHHKPITLFYAAKDQEYNHARVLEAVLKSWPNISKFKI